MLLMTEYCRFKNDGIFPYYQFHLEYENLSSAIFNHPHPRQLLRSSGKKIKAGKYEKQIIEPLNFAVKFGLVIRASFL
jgi:hypothetical protein